MEEVCLHLLAPGAFYPAHRADACRRLGNTARADLCGEGGPNRDGEWLRHFWVWTGFVIWFCCIFVMAVSNFPAYSVGEAVAWFRFLLFAMAPAFYSHATGGSSTQCFYQLQ